MLSRQYIISWVSSESERVDNDDDIPRYEKIRHRRYNIVSSDDDEYRAYKFQC